MTIQETEEEKKIPDLTPEQEAEWDGPKEPEEEETCDGFTKGCECEDCLALEDEIENDEDEDDFEDEDEPC